MGIDSLCTTDQDFGLKNTLSNLMNQIDTTSQVNGLSMHFTLYVYIVTLPSLLQLCKVDKEAKQNKLE